MSPNDYPPQTPKRIKDMDRRPQPVHIDDFETNDDPDAKWVPGSKKTIKKNSDPAKPEKDNSEAVKNAVAGSFDILHRLFIALLALGFLAGLVFLAVWIAQFYGLDLAGEFSKLPGTIFGNRQ